MHSPVIPAIIIPTRECLKQCLLSMCMHGIAGIHISSKMYMDFNQILWVVAVGYWTALPWANFVSSCITCSFHRTQIDQIQHDNPQVSPRGHQSASHATELTQHSSAFPRRICSYWPLQPPYVLRPRWVKWPGDLDLLILKVVSESRVTWAIFLCQFWSS